MHSNFLRGCLRGQLTILLLLSIAPLSPVQAAQPAQLLGYGVKTCGDYLAASKQFEDGISTLPYRRYQEWLAGFVSGLNLATGKDVLRGATIDSAMTRIRADCEGNRKQDFFNASMSFVRMLSGLGK